MSAGRVYPIGLRRGIVDGRTGKQREGTLDELLDDLERVRAEGAPDDASVVTTAPGSVYALEVLW